MRIISQNTALNESNEGELVDFSKLIEFSTTHWQLVGALIGAVGALFVHETRKQGQSLSPQQLVTFVNQADALVVDLRDAKDYQQGHITGAKNIPYADLKDRVAELQAKKETPVILVCGMGQYSGAAGKLLGQTGFKQVLRLSGGINAWTAQGLPLVKAEQSTKQKIVLKKNQQPVLK